MEERNMDALVVPGQHSLSRSSSSQGLRSVASQRTLSSARVPASKSPRTLTHAYLVCGLGREPSQWIKAPPPSQGKISHMKNAVPQFWLPEILGSSPPFEQDNEIAKAMHSALRACFPHDVEICAGKVQPVCIHHSFVLQQDSNQTLYGIALRVWSRADEKRSETIRELRRRTEPGYDNDSEETYWIPYCLSFLSRYPLFDLLGDYLRGMWIHWNKATNLFHAEEVSRILNFPAPRLNDLVRIDMKDYALCYQFPSSPTGFQNFSMWPLFACLSLPNIVGIIEAAISPARRVIFISHHPAMLTVAAESLRLCARVYEWSGLYCPVVHARHVATLVEEPGPYIIGITAECRSLFTAPPDALVVDLDRNFVLTTQPPNVLSNGQRTKMMNRLAQALAGDVPQTGVPQHLKSAYAGGKLLPAGQIIVIRGSIESVEPPEWWNQDGVMAVMDRVCTKAGRNSRFRSLFSGSMKKPNLAKVSVRHLNEIVRERNQYSRDATEAWQDLINLKGRMDTEISKVATRNDFLVQELDTWKDQFQRFSTFAEALTKETRELNVKIDYHRKETRRLHSLIETQRDEVNRLSLRLTGTEKQRDDALEALVLQQEIAEELERERQRNSKEINSLEHTNSTLARQRDGAQRVVLHLRSLITGQAVQMKSIMRSLDPVEDDGFLDENLEASNEQQKAFLSPTSSHKHRKQVSSVDLKAFVSKRSAPMPDESSGRISPTIDDRLLDLERSSVSERKPSSPSLNVADVADRHLRDKTDAISDIIRSISEQCAAAVEGLQITEDGDYEDELNESTLGPTTFIGDDAPDDEDCRTLYAASLHDSRASTVPSTPDLLSCRSSTSMSYRSSSYTSTVPSERGSTSHYADGNVPPCIMEDPSYENGFGEMLHNGKGQKESGFGMMRDPSQKLAERNMSNRLNLPPSFV